MEDVAVSLYTPLLILKSSQFFLNEKNATKFKTVPPGLEYGYRPQVTEVLKYALQGGEF